MNITLFKYLTLLFVIPLGAFAQPFTDFSPSENIIESSVKEKVNYRVTLSPLKKINSEWVAERETILRGQLHRKTFQLGHEFALDQQWQNAVSFFDDHEHTRIVFECAGYDCGSSNAWANTRFEVKQLYGQDASQFYQVREWTSDGESPGENADKALGYIVMYLVERGDRRIYLQLDSLTLQSPREPMLASAGVLAKQFYADGQITVPGLTFNNGEVQVEESAIRILAQALNEQPFKRLIIEGFAETDSESALAFALSVANALEESGVRKRRMTVQAGQLDAKDNDAERSDAANQVIVRIK